MVRTHRESIREQAIPPLSPGGRVRTRGGRTTGRCIRPEECRPRPPGTSPAPQSVPVPSKATAEKGDRSPFVPMPHRERGPVSFCFLPLPRKAASLPFGNPSLAKKHRATSLLGEMSKKRGKILSPHPQRHHKIRLLDLCQEFLAQFASATGGYAGQEKGICPVSYCGRGRTSTRSTRSSY